MIIDKFKLDTNLFLKRNIATFLRKPKNIAFIYSLLAPLRFLQKEFDDGSKTKIVGRINYMLSFSSQTAILEFLLRIEFENDNIFIFNYDNTSPSVYIGYYNEVGVDKYIGFDRESGEEIYLPKPIDLSSDAPYDFGIQVSPSCFLTTEFATQSDLDLKAKMQAIVNKYILSSRRYHIYNSL